MATSDNALLGISDSETYKRWTDSEFCIFTRFDSETQLCARRNVPVGSPFIRVAVRDANTYRDRTEFSAIQELKF